jgi:hypothetical protein
MRINVGFVVDTIDSGFSPNDSLRVTVVIIISPKPIPTITVDKFCHKPDKPACFHSSVLGLDFTQTLLLAAFG